MKTYRVIWSGPIDLPTVFEVPDYIRGYEIIEYIMDIATEDKEVNVYIVEAFEID